jgi:hypothetical protein
MGSGGTSFGSGSVTPQIRIDSAIATRYTTEIQGTSAASQRALCDTLCGATLYRTGETRKSMAAESQYWSLQNPLTPGYAGQMGMPGVNPDFIMGGSLNPGASVLTNTAQGLGSNAGGGAQVVTSPNGVGVQWFVMP